MLTVTSLVRTLPASALGLCLVAGCGGDPKPAAKTPTSVGEPNADKPKVAEANTKPEAAKPEAAKPAAPKVKVVDGARPEGDDRYTLQIEPPAEVAAGQEGQVMVRVVPKEPWHMNLDFPTSLKLTAPEPLKLVNANLKKADAAKLDDSTCEFAVKFTPAEAGEHAVTGKFKFAVCQDEACSPVTEQVEFKVAVK